MRRTKVVFVRPPNLQKSGLWKKQGVIRSPLNIALLSSYIREKGSYECALVDFEITPATTPEEMAEVILKENPRYVCFTSLTPLYPILIKIAREIKRLDSSIVNIVGGPHVTGTPQTSLFDGIDYGIIGEGEEALLELLNLLEKKENLQKIGNLLFRVKDNVIVNPARPFIKDLDKLPLPAWDLMVLNEYLDPIYFEGSHL